MASKEKFEKWLSENSLTILVAILFVALISAVFIIGVYVFYFKNLPVEADPAPWGQLGDFFGGTLNPIFGFLSVIALLAALVIQGRELKVSSEELRNSALALNAQNKAIAHQSFEQTFFSWLKNYRDMLNSVEHVSNDHEYVGGRALRAWWLNMMSKDNVVRATRGKTSEVITNDFGEVISGAFQKIALSYPKVLTEATFESWEYLYQENEYQLDSLFRNLYRLILWIDSQHDTRMSLSQKWLYISIVRAQLSWIEMVYLFYNGYTERGKNFKRLVEKYALLDNLNFDSDPLIAHLKNYASSDIRYSDTAYESRLARKGMGLPESTEELIAMAAI